MKGYFIFDMDGVLVEYRRDVNSSNCYELMSRKGYFSNLRPEWNMIGAIKNLKKLFPKNVFILTSIYGKSYPYSKQEKIDYVKRVFPELLDNLIIVDVENGETKPEKMAEVSGRQLDSSFFLIDDYGENLRNWGNSGGTPVKYLNLINNSHGTKYDFVLDCFMDSNEITAKLIEFQFSK